MFAPDFERTSGGRLTNRPAYEKTSIRPSASGAHASRYLEEIRVRSPIRASILPDLNGHERAYFAVMHNTASTPFSVLV